MEQGFTECMVEWISVDRKRHRKNRIALISMFSGNLAGTRNDTCAKGCSFGRSICFFVYHFFTAKRLLHHLSSSGTNEQLEVLRDSSAHIQIILFVLEIPSSLARLLK